MEKLPLVLIRQIIQFMRGISFLFKRNNDGSIYQIIGLTDGEIISQIDFLYDLDRISIHCACNTSSFAVVHDGVAFCDIHLKLPTENVWSYTVDLTEINDKNRILNRNHSVRKIVLNQHGDLLQMVDGDTPIYTAEYTETGFLKRETQPNLITDWEYKNGILKSAKTYRNDAVLSHRIFEINKKKIGPVREYEVKDSIKTLTRINFLIDVSQEQVPIKLLPDGVIRTYYNLSGEFFAKFYLPINNSSSNEVLEIESLSDIPDKLQTVHMVLVDTDTGSMRIIEKEGGNFLIDQVVIYENGLLLKIFNTPESKYDGCLLDPFEKKRWQQKNSSLMWSN
jgi:hypothetical protein